jgi:hypothetical protein
MVTVHIVQKKNGHGTHTLATAGGNFVSVASSYKIASGGAPRTRVASYKVIWTNDKGDQSCDDVNIIKTYNAVVNDKVDVLSVSLGIKYPDSEYSGYDGSYGSSFRVVVNGIIVVKSARNYGPNPNTLVKCEPWVITVVVGTTDIDFFCDITLGDNITLKVSYIKASIKCYFASNRLTIGFWCVSVIMQHVINLVT